MVYVRGHAYDYDRWEKEGAEGWSYADCLPYFRKSQTHELGTIMFFFFSRSAIPCAILKKTFRCIPFLRYSDAFH